MTALLDFLSSLARSDFYGEVRVRFKAGQVAGPIIVEQHYLERNLPQFVERLTPSAENERRRAP